MIAKLGHILFSLLLVFSNSGWAFSLHYCEEKLVSVSVTIDLGDTNKEPESCCAFSEENTPCCSDKSLEAPRTDDEFLSKVLKINLSQFVLPSGVIQDFDKEASLEYNVLRNYAPSIKSNLPPLYELYCRLVFYA